ncbi:MAG: hypothetical protein KA347_06620 [Bacteroidia bacterium]|nr:hypothetical protein [Bacteroidia bacterium]
MEKKEYWVEIPLNAKITVLVEAENKEEALKEAIEKCDLQLNPKSEIGYEIEEWDIYETMLEGNVWYGIIYEANAQEN